MFGYKLVKEKDYPFLRTIPNTERRPLLSDVIKEFMEKIKMTNEYLIVKEKYDKLIFKLQKELDEGNTQTFHRPTLFYDPRSEKIKFLCCEFSNSDGFLIEEIRIPPQGEDWRYLDKNGVVK